MLVQIGFWVDFTTDYDFSQAAEHIFAQSVLKLSVISSLLCQESFPT